MDIENINKNIEDELFEDFLKSKNKKSFEKLFKITKPWLFRLINKIVSDSEASVDILQNVWVKIIRGKHKFDPEKGKIKNYLFTIAKNEALHWKSVNRKQNLTSIDDNYVVSQNPGHENVVEIVEKENPENIYEMKEKSEIIRKAIKKLPGNYQDVIMLFYFSDMKVYEIAEFLNIPDGTVKIWLSRARYKLEGTLTKAYPKGIFQTFLFNFCLPL